MSLRDRDRLCPCLYSADVSDLERLPDSDDTLLRRRRNRATTLSFVESGQPREKCLLYESD